MEWIAINDYRDGDFWLKLQWMPKAKILKYRIVSSDRFRRDFHDKQVAEDTFKHRVNAHELFNASKPARLLDYES